MSDLQFGDIVADKEGIQLMVIGRNQNSDSTWREAVFIVVVGNPDELDDIGYHEWEYIDNLRPIND